MQAAPTSLRESNLTLNIEERNRGTLILESLPPVVFVELTQNCNLHCRMCRASQGYDSGLNMPRAVFDQLKSELFPRATLVDLRGWGESTILKTFPQYVRETVESGPQVRLVTNALTLGRPLWKELMAYRADVVVSVDAATSSTMKELGRGSFDRLMQSLTIGREERDALGDPGRISFNTVVTTPSLSELPDIVSLAERFRAHRITLFPVVAKKKSPLNLDHARERLAEILGLAFTRARQAGVELRIGASLHEDLVVTDGLPDRCTHPWEYCYVDYAGRIGYCDHLIGNALLTLGQIPRQSFASVWNGNAYQELRRRHTFARANAPGALEQTHRHCAWCYRRRYVDFEDRTDATCGTRIVSTCGPLPLLGRPPEPINRSTFFFHEEAPPAAGE